jgi:dUTP pyrophosphatase
MRIKFKKLREDAVTPRQGREGDACWDLVTTGMTQKVPERYIEYGTGIAIQVPEDHVGLLFPRSSVSNYDMSLANCVGIIDPNYRGEIRLRFRTTNTGMPSIYRAGEKVGQIMIIPRPHIDWEEEKELDDTNRGEGGFGSSGV